MKPTRENLLALLLLLFVLAGNAIGLWPELAVSRVDQNDNASHFPIVAEMVQAVEHGGNPLDFWIPEWSFGYPMLRTYQPLAHGMVALAYFALGKTVSLMTVFVWVRFLSVLLLPLSFFAAARLMELPPMTAAAAALLSPLISTNLLYGLEYDSYVWAGWGLFPQAVASHFLLLALGFAFRAIRRGRSLTITGALLGLTYLSQIIYGYIGAVSVCLLAVIPDSEAARVVRIRRTVWVGLIALLLAAFQVLPLFLDRSILNRGHWDEAWKRDSFGAGQVLEWLFTGDLLDHGRLPVLSLLALFGAIVFVFEYRSPRRIGSAHTFALLGAALWILVFFGRPFWGPALLLLGALPDMHLHRVIGAAQVFLLLLAAIGLAAVWRELARRLHFGAAAIATLLLLYPMVRERARYLATNDSRGRQNLKAVAVAQEAIDATIARAKERGGRAYAGLDTGWGPSFKIGYVPFFNFLSTNQVPAVGHLYHSMALPGDLMLRFNEKNPAHYRLFNIRTFVLPARYSLPAFLPLREHIGPFQIFDAPGGGYFDIVDAPAAVSTTRENFFDVNDRWLQSDWVENRAHLLLDFGGDAPAGLPRLSPGGALPQVPSAAPPGGITSERQNGQAYQAEIEAGRPCFALFKMTWHPNWKVYLDGQPKETVMLSPGFIGVPVTAGRHQILCRYKPGVWKLVLAFAGSLIVVLIGAGERRGYLSRVAGPAEKDLPVDRLQRGPRTARLPRKRR